MRRLGGAVFGVVLVLAAVSFQPASAGVQAGEKTNHELAPLFRQWLEEEVVYIVRPKEREVFLQLENDRERQIFIAAFWKQRDPTPGTERNEFKEEHYRRIAYANRWFGRDAPGPGWRTDMGRIYIILGEPRTIDRFENLTQVFPTVIWFYSGLDLPNLPASFNVVFFKPEGTSTYVLYSPMKDGPQKLLIHYMGDMTDYSSAYMQMRDIEPAIANVSLSLLPGEPMLSPRPTMSSDILLENRIPSAPLEKVKDAYAENLLRYKDVIDVDYTANYIDSDALVRVYQDRAGYAFVHYLIEPRRLTFEPVGDRYHADLDADVAVTDPQGRVVYQFNRSIPFDMTESQLASIRGKLFSYQDVFPLVPGSYKFSVLLKNRVSREFSSAEASLLVPGPQEFTLYTPCLANRVDKASRYQGQSKPFLFGSLQLTPSPRNDFLPGETLSVFFQIENAPGDVRDGGFVEYTILKETERGSEPVQTRTKSLADYPGGTNIFEEFSLAQYSPANYTLRISILDAAKARRIATEERFYVTPVTDLLRPWVLTVPQPPSSAALFLHIVGTQYMNKKDPARARPLLEAAVRREPNSAAFTLDYIRLLLDLKEYDTAKELAQPFLADERKWEFLEPVGRACQALGQSGQAIALFRDYLAHFGININVLNAVGECHLRLGETTEALAAWERSLKIEPNQPALKERVRELQEKK
jgi:GWxTD domain-containing protein